MPFDSSFTFLAFFLFIALRINRLSMHARIQKTQLCMRVMFKSIKNKSRKSIKEENKTTISIYVVNHDENETEKKKYNDLDESDTHITILEIRRKLTDGNREREKFFSTSVLTLLEISKTESTYKIYKPRNPDHFRNH